MGIVISIMILNVLVVVHELGHYIIARMTNTRVREFSIGFGPALIRLSVFRAEMFSVPLQHKLQLTYVFEISSSIFDSGNVHCFSVRLSRKNPLRHFMDAIVWFTSDTTWKIGCLLFGGYILPVQEKERNERLVSDFAVTLAGPVANVLGTVLAFAIALAIQSDGSVIEIIAGAFRSCSNLLGEAMYVISEMISNAQVPDLAGPVGIVAATVTAQSHGLSYLFIHVGILSLSLAIVNLLPIPPIDGGKLVFILVRSVFPRGGHVAETVVTIFGALTLIVLTILITFSDIRALF